MTEMNVKGVLLDIEGTTSSISYVYDTMFPYVRQHVVEFLDKNWSADEVQLCLPLLAADLGHSEGQWPSASEPTAAKLQVSDAIIGMMNDDKKATGLKEIQGLIWKDGFESGQLVAHLFDDVPNALNRWKKSGLDIRIYSSGSIAAQKLFFGHSTAGNLLDLFSGHYDTTTGSKKDSRSYSLIAEDFGFRPPEIVFLSDVAEELEAAADCGFQTVLSIRPGNTAVENRDRFHCIESFSELEFT